MYKFIGYIGVLDVTIWDDGIDTLGDGGIASEEGATYVQGHDCAGEAAGFLIRTTGTALDAWRRAAKEIRDRGGVVVHRPPPAPRPRKSKYAEAMRRVRPVEGGVAIRRAPWSDLDEFPSRRKAKKWLKGRDPKGRTRASAVADDWDY